MAQPAAHEAAHLQNTAAVVAAAYNRCDLRVKLFAGLLALTLLLGTFRAWRAGGVDTGVFAWYLASVGFACSLICLLIQLRRLKQYATRASDPHFGPFEERRFNKALSTPALSFDEGLYAISSAFRVTAPRHTRAERTDAALGVGLQGPPLWVRTLPVWAAVAYFIAALAGFVQLTNAPDREPAEVVKDLPVTAGPPKVTSLLSERLDLTNLKQGYYLETQEAAPTTPAWTVELASPLTGYTCTLQSVVDWDTRAPSKGGQLAMSADCKQLVVSPQGSLSPGQYTTALVFQHGTDAPISVPLTLAIDGPHQITPRANAVTEAICSSKLDGWFAMFVGSASTGPRFSVAAQNASKTAATPVAETVYVSETNGATHEVSNKPHQVAPGISAIPVNVESLALSPGSYSGTVDLQFEKPDEPILLPFTLDVRDSPWRAIVLFLLACGIGLAARWSNSTQSKYQDQLAAIQASISDLVAADRAKFTPAVEQLEFRIENTPEDPNLTTDLTTLQNAVDMARTVETLGRSQPDGITQGQKTQWDKVLQTALHAAEDMDTSAATLNIGTLRTYVENPGTIPSAQPVQPEQPAQGEGTQAAPALATDTLVSAVRAVARLGHTTADNRSRDRLSPARTVDELRDRHLRLLVIRAAISTVATLLLAVLAMKTLYTPGFGHSILDYAAVLAAGFAAGVAGKGLSTSLTASSFA